jgi:hypothetical protein
MDRSPALMEKSIQYMARIANHIVRMSFCAKKKDMSELNMKDENGALTAEVFGVVTIEETERV